MTRRKLLTAEQAARTLGVCIQTVRARVKAAQKIGKRLYYSRQAVEAERELRAEADLYAESCARNLARNMVRTLARKLLRDQATLEDIDRFLALAGRAA